MYNIWVESKIAWGEFVTGGEVDCGVELTPGAVSATTTITTII